MRGMPSPSVTSLTICFAASSIGKSGFLPELCTPQSISTFKGWLGSAELGISRRNESPKPTLYMRMVMFLASPFAEVAGFFLLDDFLAADLAAGAFLVLVLLLLI